MRQGARLAARLAAHPVVAALRSIDGLRLRRGELAQLEFTVVVEQPVFEQFELATAIQQFIGWLR